MFKLDNLFKSTSTSLPANFIAAAVELNSAGEAIHAGILFSADGHKHLLHFNGSVYLEDDSFEDWYVSKYFEVIPPSVASAFFVHSLLIKRDSTPKFGFYFPGSFYQEGQYHAPQKKWEYMTCVGFCLNVIASFVEGDMYLNYKDWDVGNFEGPEDYIRETLELIKRGDPEADEHLIIRDIRRITPDEYLASAFFDQLPISKSTIDTIINTIRAKLTEIAKGGIAA